VNYSPDQLSRLASLAGAWLDVPGAERANWRAEALGHHPDLSRALEAMMGSDADSATSSPALTTFSALSAVVGGHAGSDPEATTHPRAGDQVGPFRLEQMLGEGGMGTVWLADQVDGRVRRKVALKLLKPGHTHPGWRTRFERERDILAGLDHPGIARLLEAGSTAEGQPFLAMQYVAGEPLVRYANRHKLGVAQRVRLVIELLGAVQHAHSLLVVHRDLKPGNILVDEAGRVVLLDFGIAKIVEVGGADGSDGADSSGGLDHRALTEVAGSALTLDYASPEQVAGRVVGIGTDIYSLGVVLYELLCGQRPYRLKRSTRAALEEAVLEQDIAPPSQRVHPQHAKSLGVPLRTLTRQVRGDLDAIVLKALRKDVAERYLTAQGFAEDLQHWLRREPVSAQPDSRAYRLRRLLARHWQPILATGVAACGLLAATGIAAWQAHEARLANAQARADAKQARAVTNFMAGVFGSNGDASQNLQNARLRTAEQLLGDAEQRLEQDLADVPAQRIELLWHIGAVYQQMRLVDRSLELMGQAASLARQHYGADSPNAWLYLARWVKTAVNEDRKGLVAEALQQLTRHVDALEASTDVDLQLIALIIRESQLRKDFVLESDRLLPLAQRTEALWKRLPDWQDLNPSPAHILGVVYLEAQRLDKAGEMFELSRQHTEAKNALPNSPTFPGWWGRLAERLGDYPAAERWMRLGLRLERNLDGGSARVSDWSLLRLGTFLVETGRPAEALALALSGGPDASPVAREALQDGTRTLWLRSMALTRMGRLQEADRLNQRIDEREAGFVPMYRVHTHVEAGRFDVVIRDLDQIDPQLKHGQHGIYARMSAEYRTRALLGLGRAAEAGRIVQQARATLLPPGIGPLEQVRWAWLEAGVALAEGRAVEAAELSRQWLRRLQADDVKPYAAEWVARLAARLGEAEVALAGNGSDLARLKAAQNALQTARSAYLEIVDPNKSLPLAAVLEALARVEGLAGSAQPQQRLAAQAAAIRSQHR